MAPHFHKHIRLAGRDYTKGAYFVTICAWHRTNVFGNIVRAGALDVSTQWVDATRGQTDDACMELNDVGRIVDECWRAIPDHFPHARLDQMQIMPDHLHGILVLAPVGPVQQPVGSTQWVDATGALDDDRAIGDDPARPRGPVPGSLGAIIAAFKSETTKRINRLNVITGQRLWQPGYYERTIRQQGGEYGRIAQYIAANPAKWR
ncbi:MAG: transposase [Flavobacteriales bacterium]|nr:transposase [Flavobacteriales bacterium]